MRPKTIVAFEEVFCATFVVGTIQLALNFDRLTAHVPAKSVITVTGIIMLVLGSLVFLVSRARSRVAMWILRILVFGGMPMAIKKLHLEDINFNTILSGIQILAQFFAVTLLSRPSAKAWMQEGRNWRQAQALRYAKDP